MTEKQLKKLKRIELLELLIDQATEMEALQKKLEEAEAALQDRTIMLEKAGSIAEAALQINKVFAAVDLAAQDYLDNAKRTARLEAEAMLAEARAKCAQMEEEARKSQTPPVQEADQ